MLIIWGAGTLGRLVGTHWKDEVVGYTKTERNHASLQNVGITPHVGSPLNRLTASDRLLLALPGHQRQAEAIAQLTANGVIPQRIVLISSTGFYGGQSGVIDEQSPAGTSPRAQAIAQMEAQFHAWAGGNGVILRPGGLYNAERGPFIAFKRRGTLPDKPMNRTLALIHYDDVATAAANALIHPAPHPVYIAVTNPTPTRGEFYHAAVAQLEWKLDVVDNVIDEEAADIVNYDTTLLQQTLLPSPAYPDWHAIFA